MKQPTANRPEIATSPPASIGAQLRRRRLASYRTAPLPCGHQDPLDCLAAPDSPSTYGLTEDELRAHANQLIRWGWTLDEVLARLDVQPRAARPLRLEPQLGVAA